MVSLSQVISVNTIYLILLSTNIKPIHYCLYLRMRAWKCENNNLIKVWHNATIYETKGKSLQILDMISKMQDFDLVFLEN